MNGPDYIFTVDLDEALQKQIAASFPKNATATQVVVMQEGDTLIAVERQGLLKTELARNPVPAKYNEKKNTWTTTFFRSGKGIATVATAAFVGTVAAVKGLRYLRGDS